MNTIKCINIAYIFKTSIGSINGSWTEGNVSTVKKITLPNGKALPYVSGQSLRYQIRRKLEENGISLSPLSSAEKTTGVDVSAGEPDIYIDDDLLGFMIASSGENRRRTAAIRTAACLGLFPFQGDRDMGTKSKETTSGEMAAGGNIFETEIYYNFFRTNILIEVDRVGVFRRFELSKDKQKDLNDATTKILPVEERKKRIIDFFSALSNLWGGGKQTRLLTDMSPKFLIITFQNTKCPIFLESLNMTADETLLTQPIKEVLKDYEQNIEATFIGYRNGIFKNNVSEELKELKIFPVNEAVEKAIQYLKEGAI